MNKDIKKLQEIKEVEDALKDINDELNTNYHNINKLRDINKKAKQKFVIETSAYEIGKEMIPNTKYISITEMNIDELLERLPLYKILYENELVELCKKKQ